jgi:hypothetical protein
MQKQLSQLLYLGAGSLAIFGAIAQLLEHFYAPYVFSVAAAIFITIQSIHVYEMRDTPMRERRLARIGLFSSLLLGLSAYFMFTNSNLWVVALLIYALSSLFLSFRGE